MNRIYSTLILTSVISAFAISTTSAQSALITTKRDEPVGVVIVESSAVSTIFGENQFVDGYVEQRGDDFFVFPVGNNVKRRPFAAQADGTKGAYYKLESSSQEAQFPSSSIDKELSLVSTREYWDINGSQSTPITLTWDADSDIRNLTSGRGLTKLCIAGWNGQKWVKLESIIDEQSILGEPSGELKGSVTTTANIIPDQFEAYTLGTVGEGSLPVVLKEFVALQRENAVLLQWSTTSEINSSHFDIQRSQDGKNWEALGTVNALRNDLFGQTTRYEFPDNMPLRSNNLYRLKMVDDDDTFAYSKICNVTFASTQLQFAYPNPVSDYLFIKGLEGNQQVGYSITDRSGRVIKSMESIAGDGIDVKKVRSGLYMLTVKYPEGVKSMKVMINN